MKKDKVFFDGDQLWFAYSPGSGNTFQLKNPKKVLSNHPSIKFGTFELDNFIEWSNNQKPIKQKKIAFGDMKLFSIPVYQSLRFDGDRYGRSYQSRYDIFAADYNSDSSRPDLHIDKDDIVKPKKNYYVILSHQGKYDYLWFFLTKNEAMNWFNSSMSEKESEKLKETYIRKIIREEVKKIRIK